MTRPKLKTGPLFGDSFEVGYVLDLVRDYAKIDSARFSPADQEKLRAQNILTTLKGRLEAALDATQPLPRGQTNEQEAYDQALRSIARAPDPGDWTDKKLDTFHKQLLAIYAIAADGASDAVATTTQLLSKAGKKGTTNRTAKAAERTKKLLAEAAKLRQEDPTIKTESIAATLADRGFGQGKGNGNGKEAIRKILNKAKKS